METEYQEARILDAREVARFRAGYTDAFDILTKRYRNLVYALTFRILDNVQEAEDVTQETFLQAYQSLDSLKNPLCFASWLKKIGIRECWSVIKTAKRRRERQAEIGWLDFEDPYWPEKPDIGQTALYIQKMEEAIKTLSDKNCVVLDLFYVKGLSHDQIANFLEIPPGTVKRRIFDAKHSLRSRLKIPENVFGDQNSANQLFEAFNQLIVKHSPQSKKEIPMRIVILGDIHANLEAFQAVMHEVEKEKPDQIYTVGDIVGYGPNPKECVALVRELGIIAVEGNHDHYVTHPLEEDGWNPLAQAVVYWQKGACDAEDKNFLRALPEKHQTEHFIVAHTPTMIAHPPPKDNAHRWGYVLNIDDAEETFANSKVPIVFFGHSHRPLIYLDETPVSYVKETSLTIPAETKALVNVGSIGQPRDGDPRASWCLYDIATRSLELRRTEYDHTKTSAKMRQEHFPEQLCARLSKGQ